MNKRILAKVLPYIAVIAISFCLGSFVMYSFWAVPLVGKNFAPLSEAYESKYLLQDKLIENYSLAFQVLMDCSPTSTSPCNPQAIEQRITELAQNKETILNDLEVINLRMRHIVVEFP